jgi:hypothetical protein
VGFEDVEELEHGLSYGPMLFFGTWGEICLSVGPRGKISLFWIFLKLGGHVKHDESNKVHQVQFLGNSKSWLLELVKDKCGIDQAVSCKPGRVRQWGLKMWRNWNITFHMSPSCFLALGVKFA